MTVSNPEVRRWLEQERDWGLRARAMLARRRPQNAREVHGLDRFALRMGLVELTGSVAAWANGLHSGLLKWEEPEAAARFAVGPPFAATEPGQADYDRLTDYLQERIELLRRLLAGEPIES